MLAVRGWPPAGPAASVTPVHRAPHRIDPWRRWRRRALTASLATGLAVLAAGCTSGAQTGASSATPPLVTGEQVIIACYHAYFYNGILPAASAKANCAACVVDNLRSLGVRPPAGETVMDMLTGERLSTGQVQALQNACDISDANTQ